MRTQQQGIRVLQMILLPKLHMAPAEFIEKNNAFERSCTFEHFRASGLEVLPLETTGIHFLKKSAETRVFLGMVIGTCALRVTDGDGVATDSLAGIDTMCFFYEEKHALKGSHNRVWAEKPYPQLRRSKWRKMGENG